MTTSEDRKEDYFPKFMNWVEDELMDVVAMFTEPAVSRDCQH
jgi:hypothetical protein